MVLPFKVNLSQSEGSQMRERTIALGHHTSHQAISDLLARAFKVVFLLERHGISLRQMGKVARQEECLPTSHFGSREAGE
jgi:hypothetical protein